MGKCLLDAWGPGHEKPGREPSGAVLFLDLSCDEMSDVDHIFLLASEILYCHACTRHEARSPTTANLSGTLSLAHP